MKKIGKVLVLVVVIGLFAVQSTWALTCLTHQVGSGETVLSIAEQYSANPDKLIIRQLKGGRTLYLDRSDSLVLGETVYIVKEKISSSPKSIKTIAPRIAQKSITSKSQPVVDQKSTLAEKKKETGLKTDWGEAIKNWDANVGVYIQKDLDGGSEDNAKRNGKGFHGSIGLFPWEVETGERKWKFGPKVRYNQGESSVEKPGYSATYDYRRVEAGIRAETKKNDQLFGVEAGVSYQETEKENSPQGQDTYSVHLRGSFEDKRRRIEGKKIFPYTSVYAHHRQQVSAKTHGSAEEYDETTSVIGGRLAIVDLKNGKNKALRFTPEVIGELGYSQGKESPFLGIGPAFSVGDKTSDYLQAGVKPIWYTQNEGNSRATFFLSLNPDAIIRSSKAAGVKKYDGKAERILSTPSSPAIERR